ncbi:hypothetical protein ACP6H1_21685 [Vibrio harveyi]|uniref:hypothetical protein n=1 Tax=Vibrio harveyi TaxID=669 RepID=UPI003CEDAB12
MGSLTGYLGKSRNVARFENNFQTSQGSLYYAPDVGFDFDYWYMPDVNFSAAAFNTWIINEAVKRSIIILNSNVSVSGFTLKMSYTLAGIADTQQVTGSYNEMGF